MGEESLKPASTPTGAVFLSYASQDAEAGKRICEALRATGYTCQLIIDAGGVGIRHRSAHACYGGLQQRSAAEYHFFAAHVLQLGDGAVAVLVSQFASLAASPGMVFIIGEFGPGRNIGPVRPGIKLTPIEDFVVDVNAQSTSSVGTGP